MHLSTAQKSGLVWVFSGLFLCTYGTLGLLQVDIPGLEQLVNFIQKTEGVYIFSTAFLAIFLEGLYIVGNFIPGSTFVLLIAIFAQAGGANTFFLTILAIFVGWCSAGAINIFITSKFISHATKQSLSQTTVNDRILTTWYPAFRANYEVAQVVSGISPLRVFWSSVRVKIWACSGAALYALILPHLIDINELDNEDGFTSVLLVALICIFVGIWHMRR